MVLSYLTSRAFACAAHQPRQVFSAAHLQPSRDPLHREGLRPAESHVLSAAPPHAGVFHDLQITRSRLCVNSPRAAGVPARSKLASAPRCRKCGCTALKPRLATENTEGTEGNGEPQITGRVTAPPKAFGASGRARLLPSPIYLPLFVAFVPTLSAEQAGGRQAVP